MAMPGIGVRTGARILIEVGDGNTFPTASNLAAYAGLAHATRSSGSSIRGERPSRRGNKQLKRAFFLSAFAALGDPVSRAHYYRHTTVYLGMLDFRGVVARIDTKQRNEDARPEDDEVFLRGKSGTAMTLKLV